ncbi:MAG: alginate lyase family protein [Prevotella sp.]|nr:alginate lyase family protein [Prevotella sp.]
MKRLIVLLFTIHSTLLVGHVAAQSNYKLAGPYEIVARDGQYRNTKAGSERDMYAALTSAQNGQTEKALEIINACAKTLRGFDGHDAPLCAIQSFNLVRAMTLLRSHQTPEWSAMIHRAMIPLMDKFEADSPYANGNWGAIVNRLRMACGIFLEDSVVYHSAIDYFLHANDNGSLPNYIGPTGQCQETGRDQGHAQMGIGMLCDICEMAWEQGNDLWGALDNRLMAGVEYSARYNLGYDVPFETWTDCTGLYNDWTEPGEMGRGKVWEIYDKPYQHYVGRKGLKMPYTKKLLALQAKMEKQGKVKVNTESRTFLVPGVKEGVKLHSIFTYAAPKGAPLKHDYDVYVQPRGQKEWTKIDTYMAKVNAPQTDGSHKVSEISYAFFDFTGDVFVRVVTKHKKFSSARIRPDYRSTIANVQNDSTVQFLLFQPENVSVEFDGDITDNLLVFTSKPPVTKEEAERQAKAEGRRFIYFPPGLYSQDDIDSITNQTPLPRGGAGGGLTVYLAGGSYFTGTFAIDDAENVSILGRGIARPERGYEGCHVYRSKNVLVDGLIVNTCPIGGSDGVTLHDVRSISHPQWGDGLNVFGGSSNVIFDRVFCRNSDDCTTAYATRKGFSGSVRNVRMTNSTLWADVAHPIFIGLHGDPAVGDSIVNLKYDNIDIICQSEPQVDYQGCLAINCGDGNYVKDVTFDNIRIEDIQQGSILQVKVGWNRKYCTAAGAGVENVLFRNIRYYGAQPNLSIIAGYDAQHKVENVTFEGLKINGRKIYDDMSGKPRWYATSDMVPMFVGSHVENLKFQK